MYIKTEFIIILAVFLIVYIVVSGLGWYHLFLKMRGEAAAIGEDKKQPDMKIEEPDREAEDLSETEEEPRTDETEEAGEWGSRFAMELFGEIRSPLNEMLTAQERILKAAFISDAKKEALEARKWGEDLLSIIDDILDISKFESGTYVEPQENYNLENILESILSMAGTEARKKGIAFAVNMDQQMPVHLVGDERIVKRIFNILLNGAVNHTETGSVYFSLNYRIEEEKVHITGMVDDTGMGFKQEMLKDVFKPYKNDRNIAMNRELIALNFCKKSLEHMGGGLEIASIYGTGSKSSFELVQPMADDTRWSVGKEETLLRKQEGKEKEEQTQEEKGEKEERQEFSIEGVDMSIGLRAWNGNLDKYKMILGAVYTDGNEKLKEMKQYLENADYEKYMIEAHSAKSITASIGAISVSALAKEQEFAAKNQEISVLEAKSGQFLEAYGALLSNIGKTLGIVERQEEAEGKLLAITVGEVEERLEKIGGLIEDYEDEEALSQLRDLLKYDIEIYSVDFIKEIIESLNRLDYGKAADKIKNRRSEFNEEDIISRR